MTEQELKVDVKVLAAAFLREAATPEFMESYESWKQGRDGDHRD